MYFLCFVVASHNIIIYLIKDQRYRIKLLTYFYVLIVAIVVIRIWSLSEFLQFFMLKNDCQIFQAEELDTAATYLKALLGVQ